MMSEWKWLVDIIAVGGPPVILLQFAALYLVIRDWRARGVTIEAMHKEKELMYQQWIKDGSVTAERLNAALNNSAVVISSAAAESDGLRAAVSSFEKAFNHGMSAILALVGKGQQ